MAHFQFWTLEPAARWKAGTTGNDQKPFYFDCADCGTQEPPIAGIVSTDGTYAGIGLMKLPSGFYAPMMFCQPCFTKRLEASKGGRS